MNRLLNLLFIIFFILTAISCSNQSGENKSSSTKETVPQGFVFVKGGTFQSGDIVTDSSRPLVRVNDFEMLDHAVTNKEYKRFTDATGFRVPLHWENGQIPQGKEDYPVIFVNRYDVDEYLKWLSKTDGKIYRLPTTMEFEYASRGGMTDNIYPWGDDDPGSDVNFDNKGDRGFDRWIDYLQPSKSGSQNGYGLFNMAGNVWHLTVNLLDPATVLYKYRIKKCTNTGREQNGWFMGQK